MIVVAIATAWFAPAIPPPPTATRPQREATRILRNLDVRTFPNSIRPRLRKGAFRLADYGFVEIVPLSDGAAAIEPTQWRVEVHIKASYHGYADVCFIDKATNGGTYNTKTPLTIKSEPNGFYSAAFDSSGWPDCPSMVIPTYQ